jgi:hypothetical protein
MGEALETIRGRVAKDGSCPVRVQELLAALEIQGELTPEAGTEAMRLLADNHLVPDVDLAGGSVRESHVLLRAVGTSTPASNPNDLSHSHDDRGLGAAFNLAIAALAGLVVGSIAPWATTVLVSKDGLEGDGVITLILAVIIGVALWSYYSRPNSGAAITGVVCSLIAVAVAIYDVADISSRHTRIFGQDVHVVSVGWGLWLALGSAAVLVVTCFVLRIVPDSMEPAGGPGNRDLERVQKLAELRDTGALTDAEFEAQKRQILPSASIGERDG